MVKYMEPDTNIDYPEEYIWQLLIYLMHTIVQTIKCIHENIKAYKRDIISNPEGDVKFVLYNNIIIVKVVVIDKRTIILKIIHCLSTQMMQWGLLVPTLSK